MTNLAKLRWQCRRGTLELDLLLTRYFDNYFLAADTTEQVLFVELLGFEDDVLIHLLISGDAQAPERLKALVHKMRTVTRM